MKAVKIGDRTNETENQDAEILAAGAAALLGLTGVVTATAPFWVKRASVSAARPNGPGVLPSNRADSSAYMPDALRGGFRPALMVCHERARLDRAPVDPVPV